MKNIKNIKNRPAFTMLELIFVIVILGIVSSIGAELVAKVYESYIIQRAEHRATLKTELAALQIANRLASVVPGTVFRIKNDNTYESIESDFGTAIGTDYKGIQWVSSDTDSFSTNATPGWSGFCDINASTTPTISTPGSNLNTTTAVITALAGGALPTFSRRLFFPQDPTAYAVGSFPTSNTLTFTGTVPTRIVEHYKLAWSSYALVVEGGDLFLYYNFSPVPTTLYTGGSSSLLMKNISSFKFKGSGRTIRFKICKQEPIAEDINITACKEKAVF